MSKGIYYILEAQLLSYKGANETFSYFEDFQMDYHNFCMYTTFAIINVIKIFYCHPPIIYRNKHQKSLELM